MNASAMQTVTAVAFRHREPGEGVGGFEWDPDPELARARIAETGAYDDPDYETFEREYELDGALTRPEITETLDARIWDEWERA